MPMSRRAAVQRRARYVRVNNNTPTKNITVNDPDGFPSAFPPLKPPPGTTDPTLWWWDTDAPRHAPLEENLGMAAVTRATALLTNSITSNAWRTFTNDGTPEGTITETPVPRWLADPMLARPDERIGASPVAAAVRLPRAAFFSQWIRSVIIRGMGYMCFEMNAYDGQPLAGSMRVLHPDYVTPVDTGGYVHRRIGLQPDETGTWLETDPDGLFVAGGRVFRLVEMRNPLAQVDELGTTPGILAMHALELGLAHRSTEYGDNLFVSGQPSGILKVGTSTFTKPQAEQLRNDFMQHHSGPMRSVAVLNASVSYEPLQWSASDISLIESRQMSLIDIANAFGVPPYMVGAQESGGLTYSNAESRSLDFKSYSLLYWSRAAEDVLSALLPLNSWVELDWRDLTKADRQTRYMAHHQALQDGWLTIDEVRHSEGLPPLPESEKPKPVPAALLPFQQPGQDQQEEESA